MNAKKTIMKSWLFALSALLLTACSGNQMKINVANPANVGRATELVEIPLAEIEKRISLKEGEAYIVKKSCSEIFSSQVTYDGKLIFASGLEAGESAVFTITTTGNGCLVEPPQLMVFGRFIQERKDDFAWENDRVAFRIYGEALIATDGPSNGLDIWYKRTPDLVINKWYENDLENGLSYHEDHGEGLDDYKVGRTLGAGAMAPYVNDSLWLNENFVAQEVLENGPLRVTFKLTYKDIEVDGKTFSESRTFSLDAGSQLTKVQQEYGTDAAIPVAAGIVKRETADPAIYNSDYLIYTEIGPNAGEVFVGLLFPNGISRVDNSDSHYLAVTDYQPNQPVTYYTGYGWTKYGFETVTDFQQYMDNFSTCLKNPLVITYK